jgi:hypothetical protein
VTTPTPSSEEAARTRRADTLEEFGQFEAVQQIFHGNALAFDVGHPVPVGNTEKYGYEKNNMVRRIATPEEARRGERSVPALADDAAEEARNEEPANVEAAPQPASTRSTGAKKGSN